ncbi:MAG: 7 transmembrane receptor [Planctomycetota bacterium]
MLVPQYRIRRPSDHYADYPGPMCDDGSDDCATSGGCFRCLDNRTLVSREQLCDRVVDCPDLSDECACESTPPRMRALCDDIYLRRRRPARLVCDGASDYDDDEDFCGERKVTGDTAAASTANSSYANSSYTCLTWGADATSWTLSEDGAHFCNGEVECPLMEDECSARCRSEVFGGRVPHNYTTWSALCGLDHLFESLCAKFFYSQLQKSAVDGSPFDPRFPSARDMHGMQISEESFVEDCFARIDAYCDATVGACPWRFDCRSPSPAPRQHVELDRVCDFRIDCAAGARDEEVCPRATHFRCWSGERYIPRDKYLNGVADCGDRSDECVDDDFSSPHEMIKNDFLRTFVWFSAVVTIVANMVVMLQHGGKLRRIRDKHSIPYANTLLIMHLAASDLVMGLSLLVVSFKSSEYSGEYCYHDYVWRSSVACTLVGVLTVVSSQTSMNILVLLTGLRFYMTRRPFKSNQISYRCCHLLALFSWLVALLFALMPLIKSDTFTKAYLVEPSPFFMRQKVEKSHYHSYYRNTNAILNGTDISAFPQRQVAIERPFGYYSSSGVCFPDLYSKSSPEFELSFIITIYNLLALLFIAATYTYICVSYSKKPLLGTEKQRRLVLKSTNTLKRRVIYIVVTDAMSWIPIIVMAMMSYRRYHLPGIVHPLSAIVLLPINSALNPIIYSRFDKLVRQKLTDSLRGIRGWRHAAAGRTSPRHRDGAARGTSSMLMASSNTKTIIETTTI